VQGGRESAHRQALATLRVEDPEGFGCHDPSVEAAVPGLGTAAAAHRRRTLDNVVRMPTILTLLGSHREEGAPPMQHPNIDRVRGLYAAYLTGDREHVIAGLAPDIRWHNSGFDATAGTLEGISAVLDYLMSENHMEDYRLEVVDMLASDQRVAIIARTTGRLGSQRLENDFVQVMRFDGETVSEVWNYNWDQQALAAAMPATAAA